MHTLHVEDVVLERIIVVAALVDFVSLETLNLKLTIII